MPAVANPVEKSEFCSAIQQQLRNDGVFDEITAAIRSRILKSLLNENGSTAPASMNDQEMALLSLFYHHLEKEGYEGTLSVFAAESKMEHSLKFPLSSIDAIKSLGLEGIWNEFTKGNEDLSIELIPFLQAVAQQDWVTATKLQSSANTTLQVSKSIQTDKELIPYSHDTGPEHNKENASVNHCNIEVGCVEFPFFECLCACSNFSRHSYYVNRKRSVRTKRLSRGSLKLRMSANNE